VSFRPAFASRRPLASIPSWCAAALRSACATAFVAVLALTAVPAPASARSAPEGFADLAEA
jgi:hypothetical protein